MKMAKFICEVMVTDPETNGSVEVEMYKHPNGGIFGMDSSYIAQNFDSDEYPVVPDPFNDGDKKIKIMLVNYIKT
jgi:hypothetical protein